MNFKILVYFLLLCSCSSTQPKTTTINHKEYNFPIDTNGYIELASFCEKLFNIDHVDAAYILLDKRYASIFKKYNVKHNVSIKRKKVQSELDHSFIHKSIAKGGIHHESFNYYVAIMKSLQHHNTKLFDQMVNDWIENKK